MGRQTMTEDGYIAANVAGTAAGFALGAFAEFLVYGHDEASNRDRAKLGVYTVGGIDVLRYADIAQGPEPFYADNPGLLGGYALGIASVKRTRDAMGLDDSKEHEEEQGDEAETGETSADLLPSEADIDVDAFEQFYDRVLSSGDIDSLRCMGTSRSVASAYDVFDQVMEDDFIEVTGGTLQREERNGTVQYSATLDAAYNQTDAKVFGDTPALEITATLDADDLYQELVDEDTGEQVEPDSV